MGRKTAAAAVRESQAWTSGWRSLMSLASWLRKARVSFEKVPKTSLARVLYSAPCSIARASYFLRFIELPHQPEWMA